MILLNKTLEANYNYLMSFNYKLITFAYKYNKYFTIKNSALNKHKSTLLFIPRLNKSYFYNSSTKLLYLSNMNNKFISRNFWSKLINNYWQETIFISISNNISINYIDKLKNDNLSIYQHNEHSEYKVFLHKFNQHLLNGKVPVSFKNQYVKKNIKSSKDHIYIKYVWRKGINWYFFNLYIKYFNVKKLFLNRLDFCNLVNKSSVELYSLPIFGLNNNTNQIILAESADQINLQKDMFQSIYHFFNIYILKSFYLKKIYTGLLFINPKDALEYKNYVVHKYLQSHARKNIKFFVSQLNLYYKLLNNSTTYKEFRLVPDLKEVSNFIYKYQYYKNIDIDYRQKYGHNYFQGQPIYIIKPGLVKDTNTGKKKMINYYYSVKKGSKLIPYKAIFLNYRTAMMAWYKFKNEYSYYKLPERPTFYVFNLENFIQELYLSKSSSSFICIPSLQTYNLIKQKKILHSNDSIKFTLINRSLYMQNLCKKFF